MDESGSDEESPQAGRELSGSWRGFRALVGSWGWLIIVSYAVAEDCMSVIHDARTSATAGE